MIANYLEQYTFLGPLARRRREKRFEKKYLHWQESGSVLPMPHYGKQKVVSEYAERFPRPIFIETGTYTGHMVYAMLNMFEEVYSIELDQMLAEKARRLFAGYRRVHIVEGESSQVLPGILAGIQRPCLFWLDAHYSGGSTAKGPLDTPIVEELNCILCHDCADSHVLLIDDARCFTGGNDYPDINVLKQHILNRRPGWIFEVKDDIIRTHARVTQK